MKFVLQVMLYILVSFSSAFAGELDTSKSSLKWTGSKITGSSHFGTLLFKEGEIIEKEGQWVGGSFVVVSSTRRSTNLSGCQY